MIARITNVGANFIPACRRPLSSKLRRPIEHAQLNAEYICLIGIVSADRYSFVSREHYVPRTRALLAVDNRTEE
jgi:hypothetical protein